MTLRAILYHRGKLEILDQLKLPHQEIYLGITSPEDAWNAITSMQVRGAPAIAIVSILSLAVWGAAHSSKSTNDMDSGILIPQFFSDQLKYLMTSRPTAVNLAEAATRLDTLIWATWEQPNSTASTVIEAYIQAAEQMLIEDVRTNHEIGRIGADWILAKANNPEQEITALTHCNTGSLATAGYGTALGIIRSLHNREILRHVYYTETRPYNQGSRLTGYELLHDKIPATLLTDSMAASLLRNLERSESPTAVIVGADRVAANGDTANKIGTYSLAVLARYHNIKFIVAAPRTTIDLNTESGVNIVVEHRSPEELTSTKGPPIQRVQNRPMLVETDRIEEISTAAKGTRAWNPAFDITPAALIDAIVTEIGVAEKNEDGNFDLSALFPT